MPAKQRNRIDPPRYILQLDDLPKVVEADGVVYPIFLSVREASRLFNVTPERLRLWLIRGEVPVLGGGERQTTYVAVADLVAWVQANTHILRAPPPRHRGKGAVSDAHSPVEGSE